MIKLFKRPKHQKDFNKKKLEFFKLVLEIAKLVIEIIFKTK